MKKNIYKMKLFKYNQFLETPIVNENMDKAKKFMKDIYILSKAADKLNIISDDVKFEIDEGNKRKITPFDVSKLDDSVIKKVNKEEIKSTLPEDPEFDQKWEENPNKLIIKALKHEMNNIKVSDDVLREMTSSAEFKSLRELKVTVDNKDHQLDRDNPGWIYNFVYFYYYENVSIEDLEDLYIKLINNKDLLKELEIVQDEKPVKKQFDLNYINVRVKNNIELLIDGLNKLPAHRFYKKMESDLPNHLKRDLKDSPNIIKDQFRDLSIGFSEVSDDDFKGFFGKVMLDDREGSVTNGEMVFRSPISRYKNIREFIEKASGYLKSLDNNNFVEFYKKLQDCNIKFGRMGAEEVFNSGGIFIIEVMSYGANKILNGHTTHCIKDSLSQWVNYVDKDPSGREVFENKQYYIYNFNLLSSDSLSTIGVTIAPSQEIRAAHNKTDGNVINLRSLLSDWTDKYNIKKESTEKARELGASDSEISKGSLFSVLRSIDNEEIEKRRRSRTASIEIVKKGITIDQIREYVTKDGADINRDFCKALEWAVIEDDIDKAKLILELGGSPNLRDVKEAIINKASSLDMIKLLVTNNSVFTPSVYNNICHDVEAIKFCLENGLDPSFEDSIPIRRSCRGTWESREDIGESYYEAFILAIEYGAKLTDSRDRYMIINWSAEYARTDIIDYVISNGGTKGFVAAYTWLGHSRKISEAHRLETVNYLIDKIKKFENEEWENFTGKIWHTK